MIKTDIFRLFLRLDKPGVFLKKNVGYVIPYAAGVTYSGASGFKRSGAADLKNTVDGVNRAVLPPYAQRDYSAVGFKDGVDVNKYFPAHNKPPVIIYLPPVIHQPDVHGRFSFLSYNRRAKWTDENLLGLLRPLKRQSSILLL